MGVFDVSGARVVVVGAGRSGMAAAELLARRGARVTLTDLKDVAAARHLEVAGVEMALGVDDADVVSRADLVVLSPGVPVGRPYIQAAIERGTPVIGELELAARWLRGRVI